MQAETYRLDPAAFAPLARSRLRRRLASWVPATVLLTGAFLVLSFRAQGLALSPFPVAVAAGALGLALASSLRSRTKENRRAWDTFEVVLLDDSLRVQSSETAPFTVSRSEVVRLVESRGQGLFVHTAERAKALLLPEQIQGFERLRERLRGWRALEPPSVGRDRLPPVLWTVALVGSWAAVTWAQNVVVLLVAGAALLVTAGIFMGRVLELKAASARSKAGALSVLGLVVLGPLLRAVLYLATRGSAGGPP